MQQHSLTRRTLCAVAMLAAMFCLYAAGDVLSGGAL